ncbi:hypothetical protein AGMMS49940_14060 [Spirochaetia bacterium]|nr:hypothetical protein AGMMS49940_14060 [Spirochaetia bacterium]
MDLNYFQNEKAREVHGQFLDLQPPNPSDSHKEEMFKTLDEDEVLAYMIDYARKCMVAPKV